MVRKTVRINLHGRARHIFEEEIVVTELEGVEPTRWRGERALKVDEGEKMEKKIPYLDFGILQGAAANPEETETILRQEAYDAYEEVDLDDLNPGSDEWLKEFTGAITYLSIDVENNDKYGKRYRYYLWRKIREHNPDLEGPVGLRWPYGITERDEDEEPEEENQVQPASEATW